MPSLFDLLEKTLLLSLGVVSEMRERLQQTVEEMVKKGTATREQARTLIDELMSRGEESRRELKAELQAVIGELRNLLQVQQEKYVTREDLQRLENMLAELKARLEGNQDVKEEQPVSGDKVGQEER